MTPEWYFQLCPVRFIGYTELMDGFDLELTIKETNVSLDLYEWDNGMIEILME